MLVTAVPTAYSYTILLHQFPAERVSGRAAGSLKSGPSAGWVFYIVVSAAVPRYYVCTLY